MATQAKRKNTEMRPIKIQTNRLEFALGSCLIHFGKTQVLCSVSYEPTVPHFLKGKGTGWLTAEYGMLPGSCNQRIARDISKGKLNGRTQEIQRLIGRSLRACIDLERLGECTLRLDCDVIQGDGGTRTAAISGAFVALCLGVRRLLKEGKLETNPIIDSVSAVSVGKVNGKIVLDLEYEQDSIADVDMNVVMNGSGGIIEIQGTGENTSFSEEELQKMLALAKKGIRSITLSQNKAIKGFKIGS